MEESVCEEAAEEQEPSEGVSIDYSVEGSPAGCSKQVERVPECETDADIKRLRQQNVQAMLSNNLQIKRQAFVPSVLTVSDADVVLRQPFRSPYPHAPGKSQTLLRKLAARKRFVPWSTSGCYALPFLASSVKASVEHNAAPVAQPPEQLDPGMQPLVLWQPPKGTPGDHITVDPMLVKWLRPHQREGVQFMYECVAGLRDFGGQGCILADDMGLGKTLQGITLLWTLLQSGHQLLGGAPIAKRVVICCPTSLVSNWDNECTKWLKGKVRTLPLCESSREEVVSSMTHFLSPRNPYQVLIVSYETFRLHSERFLGEGKCDLLICDEAHRLKNDQTLTNRALGQLTCTRRVLLSGTPIQNHLDEFYAMVSFCNPGVLGTPSEFRRHYETPILAGREPDATEQELQLGQERSAELSAVVNHFILRRTNDLLSKHLPPKLIEVVCCKPTPLQSSVYCHFLESNAARRLLEGTKAAGVLSAITSLKKLCNHPKLIYDAIVSSHGKEGGPDGFKGCEALFPPGIFNCSRGPRGQLPPGWEEHSSKMALLARMLAVLYAETKDRIVIVSNYTQTLDLCGTLCRERNWPFVRLDGTTTMKKREKLVKAFNDPTERQFVFLLSSKAGGCGLNLIGGNRLVLFDPDWNPATDKQAAARVWRDGQKKRVFVYRFLTTGTIEEKVYQRQLSKEGLQSLVNSKTGEGGSNMMSSEELRDLFTLQADTASDTYISMCGGGTRAIAGSCDGSNTDDAGDAPALATPALTGSGDDLQVLKKQVGAPAEEDLRNWGHHTSHETVPDAVLRRVGHGLVSFVFTCEVEGKAIEEEEQPSPSHGHASRSSVPLSKSRHRLPASSRSNLAPRHSAPVGGAAQKQEPRPPGRMTQPAAMQRKPCLATPADVAVLHQMAPLAAQSQLRRPLSPVAANAPSAVSVSEGKRSSPRDRAGDSRKRICLQLQLATPEARAADHDDDFL